MEQSKKVRRSEAWEKIHRVVSKIPRKETEGDATDANSAATELEELFLKMTSEHDRRKLTSAFSWVSMIGEQFFDPNKTVEDMVDAYEKSKKLKTDNGTTKD